MRKREEFNIRGKLPTGEPEISRDHEVVQRLREAMVQLELKTLRKRLKVSRYFPEACHSILGN